MFIPWNIAKIATPQNHNIVASWGEKKKSYLKSDTWMSQEVSKWLGSVGYNPNIPHL